MDLIAPMYGQGQSVAYTGTAGTVTNNYPEGTQALAVTATTDAYVRVGPSPTAVTTDLFIPAFSTRIIKVPDPRVPSKLSAIRVSADGTVYGIPVSGAEG